MSRLIKIKKTWRYGWHVDPKRHDVHHPREQPVWTLMWRGGELLSYYGRPTRQFKTATDEFYPRAGFIVGSHR